MRYSGRMIIESLESPAAVWVGTFAGSMTTVSFLPQVVRVWQRKSAADLSYGYLLAFATGVAAWFIYGILIRSKPVITTNIVTLILVCAIVAMKVQFEKTDQSS
jgi:MtN3 and saliva related transmembrane protein